MSCQRAAIDVYHMQISSFSVCTVVVLYSQTYIHIYIIYLCIYFSGKSAVRPIHSTNSTHSAISTLKHQVLLCHVLNFYCVLLWQGSFQSDGVAVFGLGKSSDIIAQVASQYKTDGSVSLEKQSHLFMTFVDVFDEKKLGGVVFIQGILDSFNQD